MKSTKEKKLLRKMIFLLDFIIEDMKKNKIELEIVKKKIYILKLFNFYVENLNK